MMAFLPFVTPSQPNVCLALLVIRENAGFIKATFHPRVSFQLNISFIMDSDDLMVAYSLLGELTLAVKTVFPV